MARKDTTKKENSSSIELSGNLSLEAQIDKQIGDIVGQKQREIIVSRITSLMVRESFSGPIAHPKHLREYEEVSPGAADRIIAMAEKQQEHQIGMEQQVLRAEVADRKLGMWLGALAFIFLIACALATALATESEVIPGLFLTAAALGGVGLFVRGRQNDG